MGNTAADREVCDWTYIGQRVSTASKPIHAWIDADDVVRYYGGKNLTPCKVGAVFTINVDRGDGNASVITAGPEAPVFVRYTDDDRLGEWVLADRLTRSRIESDRARKRAEKDHRPFGSMTLDELAGRYTLLATADQRAGLMAVVIRYVETGR